MKKILALILMLLITLSIFASCNEKVQNEDAQAYTNEQSESLTQTEKQTQKETTKKETTKKETTKKETTKTYAESTAGLLFELNSDGNGYILTDTGNAKEIVIDGHKGLPVTELGGWLFYENKNITKITLGGNIGMLYEKTFSNCPNLKTVIIKDKITHIGAYAFENCTSLETVIIGNDVTLIDKFAFNNCTSLKNLTLGNKLQTIETCAFQKCSSLTSIVIPASAKLIRESSFHYCDNITSAEFKDPNNWGPDVDNSGYNYDLTNKEHAADILVCREWLYEGLRKH
ncbi:MAG: leucine-rich repeat domain-containing protein [Ruminococcaceae bacterium]|nr:leucine-rich repeat domain-containing protein [Oscillospiraceae bacterium]